ncbi:THxN family PEP-CTERM protein [Lacimicrobium alkaliphilum]|nr:THxN family PEP-CTERM protein [Lacimicrobium alkaliphilum]
MNKLLLNSLAGAAMVASSVASASMVITWDYTVSSDWTGANFSAGNGDQVQNASEISWGATGGDHNDSGAAAADSRSALVITDSPFTSTVDTNMGNAQSSTLTHYNNAISANYATLIDATLETSLTLTPNTPAGLALPTFTTDFVIAFEETTNTAPCGFDVDTVCDDIFTIELGDLIQSFEYDGFIYTVSIGSAGLGPMDAATCAVVDKDPGCVGFTTPEGQATPANFFFNITAQEIPEPASIAVLGMGLLMLGARRFRK